MKRIVSIGLTLVWLACANCGVASADTVNIDFGLDTGETAGNWNNVSHDVVGQVPASDNFIGDLINDVGGSTGFSLATSYANGGSFAGSGASYGGPYPGAVSSLAGTALSDSMFIQGAAFTTLTFGGLNAGETYDFLVYGARGNNGGESQYAFTDAFGTTNLTINPIFNNATMAPSITGLTPNGSGEITMIFSSLSDQGALNLIQMTSNTGAVPEPGSLLLIGFGTTAMVLRRRKR